MIQGRLILAGIPDPLAQLPSMHALLNVVEVMILDNCPTREARDDLIRMLYRPTDDEDPKGFTLEEQRNATEAFLGMFKGMS